MKKVSKLMGLILALSLVFTLASVSASASFLDDFKNITNTKLSNITNTKLSDITNVTNTKQEETAAPAQVTPNTCVEIAVEDDNAGVSSEELTNQAEEQAAASTKAVKKTRIANTGDAGIAVGASVAAVAAAAYVIAKKRA